VAQVVDASVAGLMLWIQSPLWQKEGGGIALIIRDMEARTGNIEHIHQTQL
jgi:hypothetical protein